MSKVRVSDAPLSKYHRGSGLIDGLVALRMLMDEEIEIFSVAGCLRWLLFVKQ